MYLCRGLNNLKVLDTDGNPATYKGLTKRSKFTGTKNNRVLFQVKQ